MVIHFICTGNVYRSRLAETYLNSKQLRNVKVFSSGVLADQNINGPISWYAQRIIQKENLTPFESITWQQTTKDLLQKADFTVFLTKFHLDYCKKHFSYNSDKYEVWDILDLDDIGLGERPNNYDEEIERIKATEDAFQKIETNVDRLVKDSQVIPPQTE